MTLKEAKKVKVGDKVIARLGISSLPIECEVINIIEGIERMTFCLAYQREDGKTEHITRTHMRCWGIMDILERDRDKYTPKNLHETKPVGEWVYADKVAGMRYYRCSNCTKTNNTLYEFLADEDEVKLWRFCPRCGSKMFTKEEK